MHLEPSAGTPRPVGEAIVDTLFPDGRERPDPDRRRHRGQRQDDRHPARSPTCSSSPARRSGMTCTDGIYIDGRRIEAGDCSGPAERRRGPAQPARSRPPCSRRPGAASSARGSASTVCDVGVVTNIGEGDHLGLGEIDTAREARPGQADGRRRRRPDRGTAVLNAADPLVAAMAPHCPGSVIFFARDGRRPGHRRPTCADGRQGGLRPRRRRSILAEGDRETGLIAARPGRR